MLPITDIEKAFVTAWPALETVSDGGWSARFGNGLTRRANSIQCNDPADDSDAETRLARLTALYDAHHLPPVFRVTPLTGRATFATLKRQNWQGGEFSLVLTRPIETTTGTDGACIVTAPDDPAFLKAQRKLQGYDKAQADTFASIIANLRAPGAGLTWYADDGAPLASLLCVETGGIGVFLNVVTAQSARRQGHGRTMMNSALSWLGENGAAHAALQVYGLNQAGIALYLALGFEYRYPYHYCRKPEATAQ